MDTPPSAEDLVAQAVPLGGAKPPLTVDVKDIPLPPEHLVDELDNSGAADAAAAPEAPREVATLDFFGDELPTWTHKLKYPFRWQGVPHTEITVTQLTTAEVGDVQRRVRAAAKSGGTVPEPGVFDVYAVMTGLPVAVLRALPAADGDPVTDKCFDFLPPSLRPEPD